MRISCLNDLYAALEDPGAEFRSLPFWGWNERMERDALRRQIADMRQELSSAEIRIKELNDLFKRIYEDNVCGKLSDERFLILSGDYEQEQVDLKKRTEKLKREIAKQSEKTERL